MGADFLSAGLPSFVLIDPFAERPRGTIAGFAPVGGGGGGFLAKCAGPAQRISMRQPTTRV